jgi:A/G-specific adenine glycosylase
VHVAKVARSTRAPDGMRWTALDALGREALPNVMRKVIAHALGPDALWPQASPSKTPRVRRP